MISDTSQSAPSILLIEDERDIRRFLRAALETSSYRVSEARSVQQGLAEATRLDPDLVILDLGLPGGDGVQFIEAFRPISQHPVLVLSARTAEAAKIAALDAGADDYLTKPFSLGELLARVRALLRRASMAADENPGIVEFADVRIDFPRRWVERGGKPLHLTPIEYELLALLVQNAGKVMTHRHLLKVVWGTSSPDNKHYLRVYVGHLRQKLERDPAQPKHLLTETGVGYRFRPEEP